MKISAIMFDLDDTLLRSDLTISDRTVAVLRKKAEEGLRIIPASGREKESMLPFVRRLGCVSLFVAGNGAEIIDSADGRSLQTITFPVGLAREIAAFGNSNGLYQHTYGGRYFYYSEESEYAREYERLSFLKGVCVGDLSRYISEPVTKILMITDAERIPALLEKAGRMFAGRATVTRSKDTFLEFDPLEATKGNALGCVADFCGIGPEEIIAFGDSLNDLSMLKAAGIGVAMGNARAEVKRVCGFVCDTNDRDGVAEFLTAHMRGSEFTE